ncbi:MAG: hypothetical protein ACM3JB_25230 [Acidobacteriaceae bacterium]
MSDGELQRLLEDVGSLTDVAAQLLMSEIEGRSLTSEALEAPLTPTEVVELRKLITIHRFRDLPEALIAQGMLNSAGIECYLSDDNVVRMDWFWSNLLGGVKLQVAPDDTDAALEILAQAPPEQFEVDGVGLFEQPHCPKCNSVEVSFEELNKPVAFASAYFGFPIPVHRRGWKCHSCNHAWSADENA